MRTQTVTQRATEDVVRHYYAVVGDLTYGEDELAAILHPDATLVEHPNPVVPQGARRGVEEALAGFRAGRALLSEQSFEVLELVVAGERAAVRALWQGTVGRDAGPFAAGDRLTAHIASFITVRDGLVLEHETFDCYEPFA
jgi:ketosteroid isomerase-like protein